MRWGHGWRWVGRESPLPGSERPPHQKEKNKKKEIPRHNQVKTCLRVWSQHSQDRKWTGLRTQPRGMTRAALEEEPTDSESGATRSGQGWCPPHPASFEDRGERKGDCGKTSSSSFSYPSHPPPPPPLPPPTSSLTVFCELPFLSPFQSHCCATVWGGDSMSSCSTATVREQHCHD